MNLVLDLGSSPRYLIVYMQILQNGEKIGNPKHSWPQGTQPIL